MRVIRGIKTGRVAGVAVTACAAGLLAVAAAPAVGSTAQAGWPSINFTNANTSDDTTETVLNSASVGTLHPVEHGAFNADGAPGPIVISGGRLFDACSQDNQQNTIGICAWSQLTLKLLWQTSVPGGDPGETNLTAASGELFVHADGFPYEALAQTTGSRLWQVTDSDPNETTYIPPPIVTGSVEAYFDNAGRLVERSITTGAQLLREAPSAMAPTAANNTLLAEVAGDVVVGQTVYSLSDSNLIATPLTCGHPACAPRWTVGAPQFAAEIVYAGGRLFVGGTGGIQVFNASTGAAEFVLSSFDGATLAGGVELTEVADDVIFASTGNAMYAWNTNGCGAADCLPSWQAEPSDLVNVSGAFVESAGKLYAPGGWVYAVNSVQPSPYGPAAAPSKLSVRNSHDASCTTSITWTPPTRTGGLPLTGSTVALSNGRSEQSWSGGAAYYFLPKGRYTATVAVDTPWGPGATSTVKFSVPACTGS